jgi:hypothetical protein
MIALLQLLLGQPFPAFRPIDGLGRLKSDIEVTTLDSKIESSAFILNEMQRNLKVNYVNGSSEKERNEPKKQLTSGKPFCCKYAMLLWPNKVEVRMI